MRKLSVFLGVALWAIGSAVSAQEVNISDYIPDVSLDARFGYSHDFAEDAGRFGGNGLFLDINGKIAPNIYYSLNHRLANFEGSDEPGFGNTNWLTLTYDNDSFFVTAGKEDIKVGSFEYDEYDLNCYWEMNSLFWNYISPWHWGASAGWYPSDGQTLLFQFTNSPFSDTDRFNLFAYALVWKGEWDCYESYWSTNLWEKTRGKYIKSLNLGNRFHAGDFSFDLDYTTRCTDIRKAFTSDFTLIFSPSYEWGWGRVFTKIGWERVNEDNFGYDYTGDNLFYGAGAEFFPLKEYKDLRIHTIWASNSHLTQGHYINIGLTWKLDLTQAGKLLIDKLKK